MKKVIEAVWQLKIPIPHNALGFTYPYLLVNEATLIDTGIGTKQAYHAFEKQLKTTGLTVHNIKRIILTHLHPDHLGLVEPIKSHSEAEVYAHGEALAVLESRMISTQERYAQMQREMEMLGNLSRTKGHFFQRIHRPSTFKIDRALRDGDKIELDDFTLTVIWTPGHSPEHICLYNEKRRLLFSGDHILPKITSHISLHPSEDTDPLKDFLDSLEKLRELPVDLILPAHEHVFKRLDARINELKRHHEIRCQEVLASIGNEEKTVFQIASRISWDVVSWHLMSFRIKRMAALETLAHLVYLRNRGQVEERKKKGTMYFCKKQAS